MSLIDKIRVKTDEASEKTWDFLNKIKKRRILLILIVLALVPVTYAVAAIISNVLSGTVTFTQPPQMQISFQPNAGLPPFDTSSKYVNQWHWVNITVQNSGPSTNTQFKLVFSRSGIALGDLDVQYCGPPPGTSCVLLSKSLSGEDMTFSTPTESIPNGSSIRTFKIKANVAQSFDYEIWMESSS
ncbi:MAG: hypothetical protein QXQ33_00635 [Nitrososphaerota archaeon]